MPIQGTHGSAVVAIFTIIDEEFSAIQRMFGTSTNIVGSPYFVSAIDQPGAGLLPRYDIVALQSPGQTNLTASDVVRDLIEDFRPEYILLVGIAGGHSRREVAVGDVVIADFVEDSEYFKLSQGQTSQRKRPYDHPSYRLREIYAQPLCKSAEWHSHIDRKRPNKKPPRAVVANLASGEKLLGDPKNKYQKEIMKAFEKAAVFEMEGFGLASQVFKQRGTVNYNPQYLIIRGISDLVDHSSNQSMRNQWRPYAAAAAAAFAKELVSKLLSTRKAVTEGSL